jgi:hypothetical protein
MKIVQKNRKNRMITTIALLCVIAIAVATGPAAPFASAAVTGHSAAAATGLGFWDNLTCVTCIAGFLIGGGTTVVGLAVFLQLNPELAALCFLSCSKLAT